MRSLAMTKEAEKRLGENSLGDEPRGEPQQFCWLLPERKEQGAIGNGPAG